MTPLHATEFATRAPNFSERLHEIDALRGIAALMVVLFHYTTRFGTRYGPIEYPGWGVPWGWLGVNLFFMISGFVNFISLIVPATRSTFFCLAFPDFIPRIGSPLRSRLPSSPSPTCPARLRGR